MQIHWSPLSNGNGHFARSEREPGSAAAAPHTPPADIIETKDALLVEVELPGHQLEDIELEIEGTQLTVSVERKLEPAPDRTYHRSERAYGLKRRRFHLPAIIDLDKTSATFRNGVLYVELPKREEVKPRAIQVKSTD